MSTEPLTYDPIWEKRYKDDPSYRSRYPWTNIVSFVFRNRPRDKKPEDTVVMEIGCGTGNNLWFVAREGFRASGIDCSKTAINHAIEWFKDEGLEADLRVGDFTDLPYTDNSFDLIFDRASLSFVGKTAASRTIKEIHRVLKPGGRLLLCPYSNTSSSLVGTPDEEGLVQASKGVVSGGSQVRFYSREDIDSLLKEGDWNMISLKLTQEVEFIGDEEIRHGEWRAIVEKAG